MKNNGEQKPRVHPEEHESSLPGEFAVDADAGHREALDVFDNVGRGDVIEGAVIETNVLNGSVREAADVERVFR
ncbi:MAG: hypothetical protein ACRD9W_15880, partial [Terriglobia bacterium]